MIKTEDEVMDEAIKELKGMIGKRIKAIFMIGSVEFHIVLEDGNKIIVFWNEEGLGIHIVSNIEDDS